MLEAFQGVSDLPDILCSYNLAMSRILQEQFTGVKLKTLFQFNFARHSQQVAEPNRASVNSFFKSEKSQKKVLLIFSGISDTIYFDTFDRMVTWITDKIYAGPQLRQSFSMPLMFSQHLCPNWTSPNIFENSSLQIFVSAGETAILTECYPEVDLKTFNQFNSRLSPHFSLCLLERLYLKL